MARPFKAIWGKAPSYGEPPRKPRSVKTSLPKTPSYQKIKEQVERAIEQLPERQRVLIPPMGTLPERMVGLALSWLNYQFQAQRPEDGGRLRIGGSVVDYLVYIGASRIVLRVQGDYWHSLPGRKHKDIVQAERLRMRGYRVSDVWESECYIKWAEGSFKDFIDNAVQTAA